MSTAEIQQAPGWWPSLVQVVCGCGYRGRIVDINDDRTRRQVRWERDDHVCGREESEDES
jgi:hypothetical protein